MRKEGSNIFFHYATLGLTDFLPENYRGERGEVGRGGQRGINWGGKIFCFEQWAHNANDVSLNYTFET